MELFTHCKSEVLIPETHLKVLQKALQGADAGHIGKYDSCMSYSPVTGCWRSLEGGSLSIGKCGIINMEPGPKVEVTCRTEQLEETLVTIKGIHLYEEPAISVVPLCMIGMDIVS